MATSSIPEGNCDGFGEEGEGTRCVTCKGEGWVEYAAIDLDGTAEDPAPKKLCDCQAVEPNESKNTSLVKRILKGIDLWSEKGGEVEKIREGVYQVPSRTREGCFYRVWINETGERCNCPDFSHNGSKLGTCLHTIAVLLAKAKEVRFLEPGEIRVELHRNLTDVTGAYVGAGYVIVEGGQHGGVLEILPSGNSRMFSRKNASARTVGELVAECSSRAEAHRVVLELTRGEVA